jgi:hypothetical protein
MTYGTRSEIICPHLQNRSFLTKKDVSKDNFKIIEVGYSTKKVIKMLFDKNNNLRILIFAQFL